MVKRIAAFVLCVLLLAAFVIPAGAAGASLSITADKTDVKPGDTVVLKVKLSGVDGLVIEGISFRLSMPAGLEMQSANVLCSKSFALSNFNTESGMLSAVYNAKEVTAAEWDIVEVTCKVTEAASGKMTVRIPVGDDFELFYIESSNGNTEYYDITCAECSAVVTAPGNGSSSENSAQTEGNTETENRESSGTQGTEKPAENTQRSDTGTSAETGGENKKEETKPSSNSQSSSAVVNDSQENEKAGTTETAQNDSSNAADVQNAPEDTSEDVPMPIAVEPEDAAMTEGIDVGADEAGVDDAVKAEEVAEKTEAQQTTNRMQVIYACIGVVAVIIIAAIVAGIIKKRKR